MAEEEEHPATMSPEEGRPQTARKDSRKVPGGFGIDDEDDLSPDKETFSDSIFANSRAHEENNQIPSLDPTSLPSLPPPTDSSLLYNQSGSGHGSDVHPDTLDERELHRHLNEMESSFAAAPSPLAFQDSKGWDDTYLFDAARIPVPPKSPLRSSTPGRQLSPIVQDGETPSSPPTPANAYKTPGVTSNSQESTMDAGNTTSSLETMSSSPTAAAAARTVSRAISMASAGGQNQESYVDQESLHELSDNDGDTQTTPTKSKDNSLLDSTDSRPSLRQRLSSQSLNQFVSDAGSTPGAALLNRKHSGKRPKFLHSRHASQHSSVSSIVTNQESQDGSDVTLGADYALQSGGAVPAAGFSRSTSMALSRSISLGSMASGIEDYSGSADYSGRALDASLATLTEEEQNRDRRNGEDVSPPETPRATSMSRSMAAPTDTIIARHVRNVQVPESLAQEYRSKSGVSSPNKRSGFSVSTLGRNGKNLTLKEQSSTIERLSKENFDLKLKVMFLSDRLDKLSEEGVKEMISENVDLKTGLAVMQRDNKALKRKVKELEKRLKDDEERPSTAVSSTSAGDQPSPQWFDQEGAQEREEELMYLRERVEEYVIEIEKLRNDGLARENEKRNLAEMVRNMSERRGQTLEVREEMDVWKDLLEQETARREQADEESRKLREENFRLRSETMSSSGVPGLNHTTNIYNITKKRQLSPSRPRSELSDRTEDRNLSAASTLVEELRQNCETLRHENAALRLDLSAQLANLTSRNREKDRLYQEIEELKLAHRKGGSIAGDSILERSASRAHERSASRTSIGTKQTTFTDTEREEFENKNAELRDRINSLKINNQDLQRELESCMEDFETAVEQKKQAEALGDELQEALEVAENDLLTIQAERDEALLGQDEAEHLFESLRKEAQEELDSYAAETDAAQAEIERLQNDLSDSTENFAALQNEMREMSESVIRLEDSDENKSRRIDDLERDLEDASRELEQLEKSLQESNDKVSHLTVQRESSQSEIAFLREEQDGDKIKIGDLEAGVKRLEQSLRDEKERNNELERSIENERHQRDIIAGKKQSEVERQFDKLSRENTSIRDEAQRLKTKMNAAAGDAAANRQKILELEGGLKNALGDVHSTKFSLVGSVNRMSVQLNETVRELDECKRVLSEKERLIAKKDGELEGQAMEARLLADGFDRERTAHRQTKHQYEEFQASHDKTTRTVSQHEKRVSDLEATRRTDVKKIAALENYLKEKVTAVAERNEALVVVWKRLCELCGSDWTNNNRIINGRAVVSTEVVNTMLPDFKKKLFAAAKTVETMMSDFKTRINNIEKTLWKEYHTLEENLELRTKRLDRLETMARSAVPIVSADGRGEIANLKEKNRSLKSEVSHLRAINDVRSNVFKHPSPSPSIPTGPRTKGSDKTSRTSTMTRASSSSAVETIDRRSQSSKTLVNSTGKDSGGDLQVMTLRLHELEEKLKLEREGRLQDREGSKQRLRESEREKKELEAEIARSQTRQQMGR